MRREIIRVEPSSTCLENWKAPTSAVTASGSASSGSVFPANIAAIAAVSSEARSRPSSFSKESLRKSSRYSGSLAGRVIQCNAAFENTASNCAKYGNA